MYRPFQSRDQHLKLLFSPKESLAASMMSLVNSFYSGGFTRVVADESYSRNQRRGRRYWWGWRIEAMRVVVVVIVKKESCSMVDGAVKFQVGLKVLVMPFIFVGICRTYDIY